MTYCLGIKVKDGLIGIADTRISAGTSTTIKKKVLVMQHKDASLFIMTSGLRSVRDKAVHYFRCHGLMWQVHMDKCQGYLMIYRREGLA